jgi:hypothetical protein
MVVPCKNKIETLDFRKCEKYIHQGSEYCPSQVTTPSKELFLLLCIMLSIIRQRILFTANVRRVKHLPTQILLRFCWRKFFSFPPQSQYWWYTRLYKTYILPDLLLKFMDLSVSMLSLNEVDNVIKFNSSKTGFKIYRHAKTFVT